MASVDDFISCARSAQGRDLEQTFRERGIYIGDHYAYRGGDQYRVGGEIVYSPYLCELAETDSELRGLMDAFARAERPELERLYFWSAADEGWRKLLRDQGPSLKELLRQSLERIRSRKISDTVTGQDEDAP